jgi:PAS domain S-box-containing protein
VAVSGVGELEVPAGPGAGTAALVELTSALAQAETVQQLCERALGVVETALGVDRASVLLFDEDDVMRYRAWSGLSDSYRTATEGHSPWSPDTLDPAPVFIPDVERDTSLGSLREVVVDEGIRALAFIPIVFERRVLGKYMLYFAEPRIMAEDELQVARIVADQLAVAVQRHRDERELRLSRDELKAILSGVADAITVQARDGQLVYANEAAARLLGVGSAEELLAFSQSAILAPFEILDQDGSPLDPEELPTRLVFAGADVAERTIRYRVRATGAERWSYVRSTPVRDELGIARLAVTVIQDVTEQTRRDDWQQLLVDSGAVLAESLDPEETLNRIAELVVPGVADWCGVYGAAEDGSVRRIAVAHREPDRLRIALEIMDRYPVGLDREGGIGWAIRNARSHLTEGITDSLLGRIAVDDEHLGLLRSLDLRSFMVVPLTARGRTLAAVTFATGSGRSAFTPRDLADAEDFVRRAALAIDNALLHEAERDARREAEQAATVARRLQLVTASLSGALTSSQIGDVITGQGLLAVGADAGAVYVLNDQSAELELVAQVGYPEGVVGTHLRTSLERSGPMADAFASDDLVVVESGAELADHWPRLAEAQERTGDQAIVAAPFHVDRRPAGVVYVAFRSPRKLEQTELDVVRTLAQQCGQALERARLYEQEHEVAVALQRSLLPRKLPARDALSLAAVYRPGKQGLNVGGDWYDALDLADGRIALAVGDVVGRGLEAATVMGELRNAKRPLLFAGLEPGEVLARLNEFAFKAADVSASGRAFATVFTATIDADDRKLRYASAGHPAPLLVTREGTTRFLDVRPGPPIGAIELARYATAEIELEGGMTLLLFTDGLVERRDRSLAVGLDELAGVAGTLGTNTVDDLCEQVLQQMMRESDSADDAALLAVQVLETPSLRRRIPARASELAPLRQALRRWLGESGVDDETTYDVVLAASEACANAMEHPIGRRDRFVEIEARLADGALLLHVRDTGSWRSEGAIPRRGRGLMLIRSVMDEVTITRSHAGTELRMSRRLPVTAIGGSE